MLYYSTCARKHCENNIKFKTCVHYHPTSPPVNGSTVTPVLPATFRSTWRSRSYTSYEAAASFMAWMWCGREFAAIACLRLCQMQVARFKPVSWFGTPYQYRRSYDVSSNLRFQDKDAQYARLRCARLLRGPACPRRRELRGNGGEGGMESTREWTHDSHRSQLSACYGTPHNTSLAPRALGGPFGPN
jgi:hypothetical protein